MRCTGYPRYRVLHRSQNVELVDRSRPQRRKLRNHSIPFSVHMLVPSRIEPAEVREFRNGSWFNSRRDQHYCLQYFFALQQTKYCKEGTNYNLLFQYGQFVVRGLTEIEIKPIHFLRDWHSRYFSGNRLKFRKRFIAFLNVTMFGLGFKP